MNMEQGYSPKVKEIFRSCKKKQFDDNQCKICHLFAYDPVICSNCDSAVMCKFCKDNW